MGIKIMDGNVEREVVKVVQGDGFYTTYRDAMKEGEVVLDDDANEAPAFVGGVISATDIARMNKTQLIESLVSRGTELTGNETKAELLALIEGA